MNLEGRGSSVIASKHQSKKTRPKSAAVPQKSRTEEDSYDDEEFESGGSPRLSSTRTTPRQSWMESEHEMIDMSTQTVVHSGELLCNHLIRGTQRWFSPKCVFKTLFRLSRVLLDI